MLIDQYNHNTRDYHCDSNALIENSFSHKSQGLPISCYEYHDPIVEWLDKSYLVSSITNNKFRSFLMFERTENTSECVFIRNLQGLYDRYFNQQGKV